MLSKSGLSQSQRNRSNLLRLGQILQAICTAIQPNRNPLKDLTKKKQPNAVQWTEECQKAFNQLKATLMSDPVLRAPDFDKRFLVTTDASEHGVGAVLIQEGPNQEFHPVVFLIKKLSERESHWSISEEECFYALEKLRPIRLGTAFPPANRPCCATVASYHQGK
ncbi:unnamed protein product [Lepidochelys kempii]